MTQKQTSQRKTDHIDLALKSQLSAGDSRFYYEPMVGAHPNKELKPFSFLNKTMRAPLWASSMTGGAEQAGRINQNIAKVCGKFGLGMGLGSCRIILKDNKHLSDFQLRKYLGDDVPFYANLGIAQIELIHAQGSYSLINELIEKTETDGLIIHVNPLQEWLQPEGDKIKFEPVKTIGKLMENTNVPIIVKEVGQGMGPKSLQALFELPIQAIDFGAFGGTNFALLELLRGQQENLDAFESLANIGHTANEMVEFCNDLIASNPNYASKDIIISGGIANFLDGYFLTKKLNSRSVYAHASVFLKHANIGYDALDQFVSKQIDGLALANQFLKIKE